MALKPTSNLFFFDERKHHFKGASPFLLGLYRLRWSTPPSGCTGWVLNATGLDQVLLNRSKNVDDIEFVAAAFIRPSSKREGLVAWQLENVGAIEKCGPTLYAAILEYARAKHNECSGIVPALQPEDILDKPKEIWRQFATNYPQQIALDPVPSPQHQEPWLNNIFKVKEGAPPLLDVEGMLARADKHLDRLSCKRASSTVRDLAFDLAKTSVAAHEAHRDSMREQASPRS